MEVPFQNGGYGTADNTRHEIKAADPAEIGGTAYLANRGRHCCGRQIPDNGMEADAKIDQRKRRNIRTLEEAEWRLVAGTSGRIGGCFGGCHGATLGT
jgi:hypothetical protein